MNSGATSSRAANSTLSCKGVISEPDILFPPCFRLFRGRYARLSGLAWHRERADHESRDDGRASNGPKDRVLSAGHLLQKPDDGRPQNAADTPYPKLHADAAGAKARLVGIGREVVEDMLGADHA